MLYVCYVCVWYITHMYIYTLHSIGSVSLENPNTPTLPPGSQKIRLEARYFHILTDPNVQAEPLYWSLCLRVWGNLKGIKFSPASGKRVPPRRLSWAFPQDSHQKKEVWVYQGASADAPPSPSGLLLDSFPRAASTNYTDWMTLDNRNLFFHGSGGPKSKMQALLLSGWVLSGAWGRIDPKALSQLPVCAGDPGRSLACRHIAPICLHPHVFSCVYLFFTWQEDTRDTGDRAHPKPVWLHLNLLHLPRPCFPPKKVTFWGSGLTSVGGGRWGFI